VRSAPLSKDRVKAGRRIFVRCNMTGRICKVLESVKQSVLERDAHVCVYCNGEADEIDHIMPYSYKIDNGENNLVACCRDCNAIAYNKIFKNFAQKSAYIQRTRGTNRWSKKFKKRYAECAQCHLPFKQRSKESTKVLCNFCAVIADFHQDERADMMQYRLVENGRAIIVRILKQRKKDKIWFK